MGEGVACRRMRPMPFRGQRCRRRRRNKQYVTAKPEQLQAKNIGYSQSNCLLPDIKPYNKTDCKQLCLVFFNYTRQHQYNICTQRIEYRATNFRRKQKTVRLQKNARRSDQRRRVIEQMEGAPDHARKRSLSRSTSQIQAV